MKCVYPCVLSFEEGYGFSVIFPDFAGATQGDTLYEALMMAEDFLNFAISSSEDDGDKIPEPTPLEKVKLETGEFVTLIKADTDEYRKKFAEVHTKEITEISSQGVA